MRNIFSFFVISFLFFSSSLFAQDGNIRGFVYDKATGEPIIFTNVVIKGTTYGAPTDQNGYFSITNLPAGTYTVIATSLGYETSTAVVELKENGIENKKFYIAESSVNLDDVIISADKVESQNTVKMSVTKLTPKEIKKMPSIGGEPDLAQYLQVLPGVVFTGDQGGQLYIRGGSPVQNKVLLDGMIIYNPFHSIGLFSVFDTDIMRNADVYTGGYGAEYGGRISSIMDITTRDGNKKRLAGKVSATTFGAKALLEGPIKKQSETGGGSSSFLISAKSSYIDQSSELLYNNLDADGLPYTFTDLYGKVSLNADNGSKINFFGFNFKDEVDYPSLAKIDWNSVGLGANFVLIPARSQVLMEGVFAYSKYETGIDENNFAGGLTDRNSLIKGFNMGMNFTSFSGSNESKYGFEINGFSTDFSFINQSKIKVSQAENTTEIAGYFTYTINKGRFVIEPGLRLHYFASLSELSPEPRLGLKFNATDKFRLKFASGMYAQNLMSASSDRDIVNLFYGFLSGPQDLQDNLVTQDGDIKKINSSLQKAQHFILGFEYDITRNLNVNVEGYLKRFTQLTNLNRNQVREDVAPYNVVGDEKYVDEVFRSEYVVETGNAYGVDIVFKYEKKQISLWAVYSLGKVTRWDGIQEYSPVFDRRHNVNLVGSYAFGEDRDWSFDARWNLGSGFPFTQTSAFYEQNTFTNGINTDYVNQNGELGIQYGQLSGGRLPYYHRLDISLKKKFIISKNSILEATASVTNVYDRKNIFYVNRVTAARKDQLPILPSVGVSLTF
jgi:hypothetical protein